MAITVTRDADAFQVQGHRYRVSGTIAFDSSYPVGGETLTPNDFGLSSIEDILVSNRNGYSFEFDKTNTKLKVFSGSPTSTQTLYMLATAVTSSSTAATNMVTYSLPANKLGTNGSGLRIKGWGTTAANTNNKTVRLLLGDDVIITTGASAANASKWWFDATIIRTNASVQESFTQGNFSSTAIAFDRAEFDQDLTAALTLALEGTSATATNNIVVEGMMVELLPAGTAAAGGGTPGEVDNATSLASLTGARFVAMGV